MKVADRHAAPGTTGRVLHEAARYDLLVWLVTLGRERAFREKILRLASLAPGQTVLDVGCGTGTLAIAAKRQVGPGGTVHGIDASPEMLARAGSKARKAGVDVVLTNAPCESLPFADAHFDVVLSTVMMHHLPPKARLQSVREIRRVLKPGGRVLVVDFEGSAGHGRGLLAHFHRARHGHVKASAVVGVLVESGFTIAESGAVGMADVYYVLAIAPST